MEVVDAVADDVDTFIRDVITESDDCKFESTLVLPGDIITHRINIRDDKKIQIGKGLMKTKANEIISTVAGLLKHRLPNTYWIEPTNKMLGDGGFNKSMRYVPVLNDQVIGIIEEKSMEYYKININSYMSIYCHRLAFENATKRNKPELKKGIF